MLWAVSSSIVSVGSFIDRSTDTGIGFLIFDMNFSNLVRVRSRYPC